MAVLQSAMRLAPVYNERGHRLVPTILTEFLKNTLWAPRSGWASVAYKGGWYTPLAFWFSVLFGQFSGLGILAWVFRPSSPIYPWLEKFPIGESFTKGLRLMLEDLGVVRVKRSSKFEMALTYLMMRYLGHTSTSSHLLIQSLGKQVELRAVAGYLVVAGAASLSGVGLYAVGRAVLRAVWEARKPAMLAPNAVQLAKAAVLGGANWDIDAEVEAANKLVSDAPDSAGTSPETNVPAFWYRHQVVELGEVDEKTGTHKPDKVKWEHVPSADDGFLLPGFAQKLPGQIDAFKPQQAHACDIKQLAYIHFHRSKVNITEEAEDWHFAQVEMACCNHLLDNDARTLCSDIVQGSFGHIDVGCWCNLLHRLEQMDLIGPGGAGNRYQIVNRQKVRDVYHLYKDLKHEFDATSYRNDAQHTILCEMRKRVADWCVAALSRSLRPSEGDINTKMRDWKSRQFALAPLLKTERNQDPNDIRNWEHFAARVRARWIGLRISEYDFSRTLALTSRADRAAYKLQRAVQDFPSAASGSQAGVPQGTSLLFSN